MSQILPDPYTLSPSEFVVTYRDEIDSIMTDLGYTDVTDAGLLAIAESLWTGVHGRPNRTFTPEELAMIRPRQRKMGFYDGAQLPEGTHTVFATGLKYGGMERAFRHFVREGSRPGVTIARIVFMTGQRAHNPATEASLGHMWSVVNRYADNPLAKKVKEIGLFHEADFALVAALEATNGAARLVPDTFKTDVDTGLEPDGVEEHRSWTSCELELPGGIRVQVQNTPAIRGEDGAVRGPSAASVTDHFLKYYGLPEEVDTLTFRNGMTHIRVSGDMRDRFLASRRKLTFMVMCEAASDEDIKRLGLDKNAFCELLILVIRGLGGTPR